MKDILQSLSWPAAVFLITVIFAFVIALSLVLNFILSIKNTKTSKTDKLSGAWGNDNHFEKEFNNAFASYAQIVYDVFISYSRRDIEVVRLIKSNIEELTGVRCWMDLKAIESGSKQFTKDIVDGINNCEVFLFMLSEHSQKTEFALRELEFANEKKKRVVIVNINYCQLNDEFQFMYGLSDRINWKDELQREKLMQDLKKWRKERERIEAEKKAKEELERQELKKKEKRNKID